MPERPRWSRDAAVPNNWWPAGSRTKDNVTLDLNCDVIELALASSKFQYLFLVFSRRFRATFPIRVITGAFKWLYRCLLHVSSFLAFDLTQWKFTKCMWENWLLIFKILVFAFVVCLQKSFETRFSGTVYFLVLSTIRYACPWRACVVNKHPTFLRLPAPPAPHAFTS